MLHIILLFTALANAHPAVPLEVDYEAPEGFVCQELKSDSLFFVLQADSTGKFIIVPLSLSDNLPLPVLSAWNQQGDTITLESSPVSVTGWLPDSIMTPSLPPFPGFMDISPGFPRDYARNVSFWLVWGNPPGFPWLFSSIGLLLAIALAFLIRLKMKKPNTVQNVPGVHIPLSKAAENEALSLLESEHFIHGHWAELYTEIDSQFRATVAVRFGIVNKAFTINQIAGALAATAKGRKFMEQALPITKEVTLQRYADWGSSRERASSFIKKLAKLRGEWSK